MTWWNVKSLTNTVADKNNIVKEKQHSHEQVQADNLFFS